MKHLISVTSQRLVILLCFITSFCSVTNAQDSVYRAKFEEYIKDNNDKHQPVASLRYDPNKKINLNYGGIKSNITIRVDSISFLVKDGYIIDINVYSADNSFSNSNSPIDITSRRFSKNDRLQGLLNRDEYIGIKDVFQWKFYNNFAVDDGLYWLTPTNKEIVLKRNVGINNVLDLRLYSDALGLFGGKPNAIAQTDARFKHIIYKYNYRNSGVFIPGHYVKVNFNAAKFDSQLKYADSAKFSRSKLLQKSYISAEVAVNLISGWAGKKSLSSLYLDAGVGLNMGYLAKKVDTVSVTTPNLFFEAGANLKTSDNIGADLYARFIKQYSAQTNFTNAAGEIQNLKKNFWKLGAELYWNAFENKANRLFARFNYFVATDHVDSSNQFVQFQFGYSVLLSSLAKGKGQ
ncbi:hypothetical protein [Mucilaginibacter terrae]|uniref:DUF3078 domain-containing protein n=1 Tax=Mucilaginibacter terrae TaxID=1955052 RepID=A0ABU3GPK2_9SPHI|nr:hypothetical protein [Mucilaginibacter terrae]MDT3401708.1 hypothetical protein [Mucilaginibacter terrae]